MTTKIKKVSNPVQEEIKEESKGLNFDLKPPVEEQGEPELEDILDLGALDIKTKTIRLSIENYGSYDIPVREISMNEAIYSWNLFLKWSRGEQEAMNEFIEWLASLTPDPLKKAYLVRLNPSQIKALFAALSPLGGNLDEGVGVNTV